MFSNPDSYDIPEYKMPSSRAYSKNVRKMETRRDNNTEWARDDRKKARGSRIMWREKNQDEGVSGAFSRIPKTSLKRKQKTNATKRKTLQKRPQRTNNRRYGMSPSEMHRARYPQIARTNEETVARIEYEQKNFRDLQQGMRGAVERKQHVNKTARKTVTKKPVRKVVKKVVRRCR
jgi:hypothetical protein